MAYTITDTAKQAAQTLTNAVNAPVTYRNTLDQYVAEDKQLRKDYADMMDYEAVKAKYDQATEAAYELSKLEQIQAMNKAESANYANTKAGIKSMRDALVGSASSGANVGAANATALQALLGLGQSNSATTTEGMQAYQNNAKEMAAQKAANATTALEMNKSATDSMYGSATSTYGSDASAMGQGAYGAGTGLGTVASTVDQGASNERMNKQTTDAEILAAKLSADATVKAARKQKKNYV